MTIGQVVGIVGDASTYGIPCAERLYGAEIIGRVVEGAPGMPRYEDHGGNELGVIFNPHEQSCDGCLQPILDCSGPRREEEEDAFRNTGEHVKRDTSYTLDGVEVSCTIDPEKPEAVVQYGESIHFVLNPDFPQDARALFDALCNVRDIVILEDEEDD